MNDTKIVTIVRLPNATHNNNLYICIDMKIRSFGCIRFHGFHVRILNN